MSQLVLPDQSFTIEARDVDGGVWTTFITVTASNSQTCDLAASVTIGGAPIANTTGAQTLSNKRILAENGSASAPAYSFASDTNSGLYWLSDDSMAIVVGGNIRLSWNGYISQTYLWGARINVTQLNISDSSLNDLNLLNSEGSNNLALRNGTNAQKYRVYHTFTDSSNYERLALQTGSGYVELAAETAGAGADNIDLRLTPAGAGAVRVAGGVAADGGGLKHKRVSTGAIGGGANALVTVTWDNAFADANYTVAASVVDATTGTASLSVVHVESVTASTVSVRVYNAGGVAITGALHVIAIHD
jgi:hypothetical protein